MEAQRRTATTWEDIKDQKKIYEEGATFHEMSWSENKSYVMFCLALKKTECDKNESCSEGRDEGWILGHGLLAVWQGMLSSEEPTNRHSP